MEYNPHNVPIRLLPRIICHLKHDAFVEAIGDVFAVAETESGEEFECHLSTSEAWARHDMGVDHTNHKHAVYRARFPHGYVVEWR